MSLFFFEQGYSLREGVKFSKILRGDAHKRGVGRSDRFRIFFGGGPQVDRGEVNISGWGCYPGGDYV